MAKSPNHRIKRRGVRRSLEPRQLLAGDPFISEFLASNEDSLLDGNGRASDWIEIFNPNQTPFDFAGWHLTDVPSNRIKWTFPTKTIGPGGYLIVFASGDNAPDPAGNLHTNFQIDADGDYLALVKPDHMTIVSEYNLGGVNFPDQDEDISYGRGQQTATIPLVAVGGTAKTLIPTVANGGDALGNSWTGAAISEPFDDTSWISGTTGVGYGDFRRRRSQPLARYLSIWTRRMRRPVRRAGQTQGHWAISSASAPDGDDFGRPARRANSTPQRRSTPIKVPSMRPRAWSA